MSRKFREWSTDQNWLFPPSPQDWLPQDHLIYFLLEVSEQIEILPIVDDYDSEKGWFVTDAGNRFRELCQRYANGVPFWGPPRHRASSRAKPMASLAPARRMSSS